MEEERKGSFEKLNYIFNRREKLGIAVLGVAVVIGSFLELMGVAIFQPFINVITDSSMIHTKWYLEWLYQFLHARSDMEFISDIAVAIIIVYIIKNVYLIFEKNFFYKFSYRCQMRLSDRLFKAYLKEPYTFHLNRNVAELQRTITTDTDSFTKGIIHSLGLIAELITCLVLGIYLFIVSKSIAIIVLILLLFSLLVITRFSKKISVRKGRDSQKYQGKIYQWINQSLGGIKEIKILRREGYFEEKIHTYFQKLADAQRVVRLTGVLPKYFIESTCMTGMMLAIIVKINYGQKALIDFVPQLAVFAVAAFRMLPSVGRINEYYTYVMYAMPSLDLIYHDLKDIENLKIEETGEIEDNWKLQDKISVSHVSYCYPDASQNVLEDVSFSITKGTSVAFIGASGAGKTTMADIILGLLQPQIGHVYADSMDIHRHLMTWDKEIGYIPQTIYLSDDTIRNNIAFGIDEKDIDEDAVINAAKEAQLYEFVESLPDGLDTFVGDRGVRISGGQRQRIGIARALYHNPEVLVLDEATSALDTETETAVMKAIDSLHGSKTMLIIAHRLTTIRNVDQIFEIGNGKVTPRSKSEVFS